MLPPRRAPHQGPPRQCGGLRKPPVAGTLRDGMALPDRIALVGFMGSGKSTVGRLLATAVGYQFVDVDTLIERAAGMTIPELFRRAGEEAFRALETRLLLGLGGRRSVVIATGGRRPDARRQPPVPAHRVPHLLPGDQRRRGAAPGRRRRRPAAAGGHAGRRRRAARGAPTTATRRRATRCRPRGAPPLQVVAAIRALL